MDRPLFEVNPANRPAPATPVYERQASLMALLKREGEDFSSIGTDSDEAREPMPERQLLAAVLAQAFDDLRSTVKARRRSAARWFGIAMEGA